MTYKSIIQILLILAIISTICISIIKPKMHEPVMVLNSQFSVEQDDGINIDEQNIAVLVQDTQVNQDESVEVQNEGGINFVEPKIEDVKPVGFQNTQTSTQNTVNFQNQKPQSVNNIGIKNNTANVKTTPVKTSNNTVKTTPAKVNNQPAATNKPITANKPATANSQSPKIDLNKIVNNNQKIVTTPTQTQTTPVANAPVTTAKPQQTASIQTTKPLETKPPVRLASQITSPAPKPVTAKIETEPVVLTAQQEEIAWNKWRSNLNNQIMKDSKLPTMPNGIIFKYKFTVDKYGKVTNVQTSSTTPGYTPYAIQFIAPVIRSYQGRSILNFPAGSKRLSTEVSGAWKISNNSKLSTPDDYHDIEKVKK